MKVKEDYDRYRQTWDAQQNLREVSNKIETLF